VDGQRDSLRIIDLNYLQGLLVILHLVMWLTADMTVNLTYPKELDKGHMVMPGDNVELVCELIHPLALDKGMRFTIRMFTFQ